MQISDLLESPNRNYIQEGLYALKKDKEIMLGMGKIIKFGVEKDMTAAETHCLITEVRQIRNLIIKFQSLKNV